MNHPFENILPKYLNSEERIAHSLRVAKVAEEVANKLKIDPNKAYTAGLLHDIAKDFTFEKAIQTCRNYNYTLSESELFNKKLLHAPISALIANHELNIKDTDILSAIKWHTTGRANMNTLEKIIYLADKIEPERKYPEINQIKKLITENIDKAMLYSVKMSLAKLLETNRSIDFKSIECYNSLVSTIKKSTND
jgi:predicted HD superfamily hydrolase involved in NAD metabolism